MFNKMISISALPSAKTKLNYQAAPGPDTAWGFFPVKREFFLFTVTKWLFITEETEFFKIKYLFLQQENRKQRLYEAFGQTTK